jgi:hypothetical protein
MAAFRYSLEHFVVSIAFISILLFLNYENFLILVRQKNGSYREVVAADDPKLIAPIRTVAGKNLETTFQAELVFDVVPLAQVSPITTRVTSEKLLRTLPFPFQGSQRAGCRNDLSQREKRLLRGLFHGSELLPEGFVISCFEAPPAAVHAKRMPFLAAPRA